MNPKKKQRKLIDGVTRAVEHLLNSQPEPEVAVTYLIFLAATGWKAGEIKVCSDRLYEPRHRRTLYAWIGEIDGEALDQIAGKVLTPRRRPR